MTLKGRHRIVYGCKGGVQRAVASQQLVVYHSMSQFHKKSVASSMKTSYWLSKKRRYLQREFHISASNSSLLPFRVFNAGVVTCSNMLNVRFESCLR